MIRTPGKSIAILKAALCIAISTSLATCALPLPTAFADGAAGEEETIPEEDFSLEEYTPILKSASNVSDGIELRWDTMEEAEGYEIQRSADEGETWNSLEKWAETRDEESQEALFQDKDVKAGKKYLYRIVAFATTEPDEESPDQEESSQVFSNLSEAVTCWRLLPPKTVSVTPISNEIQISWSKSKGAEGYFIYKMNDKGQWKRIKNLTTEGKTNYDYSTLTNAVDEQYMVVAYHDTSKSVESVTTSAFWLAPPESTSISWDSSKTTMEAQWTANEAAEGYQVQYSKSKLFTNAKTINVAEGSTESIKLSIPYSSKYRMRVRTWCTHNGATVWSAWRYSNSATATTSVKSAVVKRWKTFKKKVKKGKKTKVKKYKKKVATEIASNAKQVAGGYDTLQGTCSDGKYAYCLLLKQGKEQCKIAKVKLSTGKVTKVSKALSVGHGNDVTYNADLRKLVVANCRVNTYRITFVDPSTLTVTSCKTIKLDATLPGCSASVASATTGVGSIAYCSARKQYVTLLKSSGDFLILDSQLNPVRVVSMGYHDKRQNQSLEVTDQFIMLTESPYNGLSGNIISVYDWEGNYISRITLRNSYEVESIFFVGSKLYVGYYCSSKGKSRKNYLYKLGSI